MKQRKSFIEKVKQMYAKYKVLIIGIALFLSGYLFSSNLLEKPISNSEFEFYEQVARDVYEQGDKAIYEIPNGVSLERTDETITISSARGAVHGKVVATLQNGELVFTRNAERGEAILKNSLIGILFVIVPSLLWISISSIKKKI